MKCNLECPYSKPNGRDRNGNQNIICESRKWYMTDTDDCIEKFDEKTISQLKGIFGDTIMPREKFRVFTEIPTNEKMIVNMINDEELTLEDACDLLNKQDQDIQKYRDAFYKAHEIQQDFIKQIQQIKSIMDNELKNAFNNRINHDDYNKDPELAEYFKGYHCGVSDLIKKIMEVLH